MAVWNDYAVEYRNGTTWTAIDNAQQLTFTVGRQLPTDPWQTSTGTIRVWYPNGYSTPIANLAVGSLIRWFAPGRAATKPTWTGYVRNVFLEVDIPWTNATGTGNGDFLVIECEGELAKLGRSNAALGSATVINLNTAIGYLQTATGAEVYQRGWSAIEFNIGYAAGTYQALQHANVLATTSNARIVDGVRVGGFGSNANSPGCFIANSSLQTVAPVAFSDTANDATHRLYDGLQFDGLADNYFTEVVVTPQSGGAQTKNYGSAPYRTLELSTYSLSTGDGSAANLAALNLNLYKLPTLGVSQLSATSAGQHTQNLDTLGVTDLEFGDLVMRYVLVDFRGTTYAAQIEGAVLTATADQTRITYYLAPATYAGWLTLDDATLGVLDQNRLGFTRI